MKPKKILTLLAVTLVAMGVGFIVPTLLHLSNPYGPMVAFVLALCVSIVGNKITGVYDDSN